MDDERFAWELFYEEHAPTLRKFIRRRVPAGTVEDTLQETFARAFRSRHRFDPRRPVWPWLVTIAIRACAEARRVHPPEVPSVDLGALVATQVDPHESFERHQRAEAIVVAMTGLSPRHRRVLTRWELDGMAYADLAADEGLTRQALKSVLCRARTNFRKGYDAAAARAGLVGIPAFWFLLRRLRARLGRLSPNSSSRVAELAVSSIAVVTLATIATVLPTGANGGPFRITNAGAGSSLPVAVGQAELDTAVAAQALGNRGTVPPPPHPAEESRVPASTPKLPVGASGQPDVRFTPDDSTASLTVSRTDPLSNGTNNTSVTVKCVPGLWATVCSVVRATPNGR